MKTMLANMESEVKRVLKHTNGRISWEALAQQIAGGEKIAQPICEPSVAGRWQNGWPIPMDFLHGDANSSSVYSRVNQKYSKEVGCCIQHLLGRCKDGGKGGAAPLYSIPTLMRNGSTLW